MGVDDVVADHFFPDLQDGELKIMNFLCKIPWKHV